MRLIKLDISSFFPENSEATSLAFRASLLAPSGVPISVDIDTTNLGSSLLEIITFLR